jgi:hypothetical protein
MNIDGFHVKKDTFVAIQSEPGEAPMLGWVQGRSSDTKRVRMTFWDHLGHKLEGDWDPRLLRVEWAAHESPEVIIQRRKKAKPLEFSDVVNKNYRIIVEDAPVNGDRVFIYAQGGPHKGFINLHFVIDPEGEIVWANQYRPEDYQKFLAAGYTEIRAWWPGLDVPPSRRDPSRPYFTISGRQLNERQQTALHALTIRVNDYLDGHSKSK